MFKKQMHTMKISMTLLAAAALLAVSCSGQRTDSSRLQTVKVDTVRLAQSRSRIQYPGKVVAPQEISLSFRVSGTIDKVLAWEGASVRAGQLLAILDTADYRIQLDATEAEYAQVKGDAERTISLYKQDVTTKQNYDKAVYGLRQIEAKLDNHRNQLAYCRLYAPADGVIQSRMFEPGENVSAGLPVLTMLGGGAPNVEIHLSAADYIRRQDFRDWRCSFEVYPGKVFSLRPVSLSPKANANQLYTYTMQVQPCDGLLPSPGMNTTVRIDCVGDDGERLLTVTSGALFAEDDAEYVYVISDNVLSKRRVECRRLLSDGNAVIVSGELEAGDAVVASGTHFVKDGERVKPLKETSKTNIGGIL